MVTILHECGFYPVRGIENLEDRGLLSVDDSNKLRMHQLLQQMGKEIIRQKAPDEPGKRCRLWRHEDSLNVLKENTVLKFLKILNLSHSRDLTETPDFFRFPNLEKVILKGCYGLVEVHESIGDLETSLISLNLKGCKRLRKLPRTIDRLKVLETLIISGWSSLDRLPEDIRMIVSLRVFLVDGVDLGLLFRTWKEETS
ncbi:hypothetical protein RJ640_024875 [Escallonia rubra]|uniref:Disease resistance protein Roq1-like winged-helix domain-containing protein n=1 Tax=Escallonia rubra TaxID=112253 RepID=A0AA88RDP4_9ASTE|nr:hypothetical protein RJ640_024875 [Escallonia rubra]